MKPRSLACSIISLFLAFSITCTSVFAEALNNINTQPVGPQNISIQDVLATLATYPTKTTPDRANIGQRGYKPVEDDDQDGDFLSYFEEKTYFPEYSPFNADSNFNNVNDGDEDYDFDNLTNLQELRVFGTRPDLIDSNFNGINDGDEDYDNDKIPNALEVHWAKVSNGQLDVTKFDINNNTISDGMEDFDNDGVPTYLELLITYTNPFIASTNGSTVDNINAALDPLTQNYTTAVSTAVKNFNATQPAETQITEEMAVVFDTFKTSATPYAQAFTYIRQNITTDFYINSRKGARGTFEERSGNDLDTSSLLIAAMRYLGYTANYVWADTTFSEASVKKWTGYNDITVVDRILSDNGKRTVTKSGGNYVIEHFFVQVIADNSTKHYTPSFKVHKIAPTVIDNVGSAVAANSSNTSLVDDVTALLGQDYSLKSRVVDKTNYSEGNISTADALVFTGIQALEVQYNFYISDVVQFEIANNPIFRTAELYGNNITYYYKSATANNTIYNEYQTYKELGMPVNASPWDLKSIFNFSSMSGIGSYKLFVTDVLKIGDTEYNGNHQFTFGDPVNFTFAMNSNGASYTYTTETNAGEMASFVFDFGTISGRTLADSYTDFVKTGFKTAKDKNWLSATSNSQINGEDIYSPDYLGKLLRYIGVMYWSQEDIQDAVLSSQMGIYTENPVRVSRFCFAPTRSTSGNYPYQGVKLDKQGSFYVDVIGDVKRPISTKSELSEAQYLAEIKAYNLAIGMVGSALEHSTLEMVTGIESVSAVKLLELCQNSDAYPNNAKLTITANDAKTAYYVVKENDYTSETSTISSTELLGLLVGNSDKTNIIAQINAGATVTTTMSDLQVGDYKGSGYIVVSADGLSCQFIIRGGLNGGALCAIASFLLLKNIALDSLLIADSIFALYILISFLNPGAGFLIASLILTIITIYLISLDMKSAVDEYFDVVETNNLNSLTGLYNRAKANEACAAVSLLTGGAVPKIAMTVPKAFAGSAEKAFFRIGVTGAVKTIGKPAQAQLVANIDKVPADVIRTITLYGDNAGALLGKYITARFPSTIANGIHRVFSIIYSTDHVTTASATSAISDLRISPATASNDLPYVARLLAVKVKNGDIRDLTGKKFKPAKISVVSDSRTGKVYWGGSGKDDNPTRNATIHRELRDRLKAVATTPKPKPWDWDNCAEFNAINNALKDKANFKDLVVYTIDRKTGNYAPLCENCEILYLKEALGDVISVITDGG